MISYYTIPTLITSLFVFNFLIFILVFNFQKLYKMIPLICATFIWHGSWCFIFNTQNHSTALTIAKIGHVAILYLPVALYWLFGEYLPKFKQLIKIVHIVYLVFLALLFSTDTIVSDVNLFSFGFYPVAGVFHPAYLSFITLTIVYCTYVLYKQPESKKFKIELISILIFSTASVDFLLNYKLFDFYPFGFIFSWLFIAFLLVAQIKFSLYQKDEEIEMLGQELIRKEKLATIGLISSGLNHEIGNALSGLASSSSIIRKMVEKDRINPETLLRNADQIKQSTDRAFKIIDGLKVANHQGNNYNDEVDLHKAIENGLSLLSHDSNNFNIVIESNHKVIGNETSIVQVVVNLVKNAMDAIENQENKKIEIKSNELSDCIELTIWDSGQGIRDEIKEKIFEPFFSTKDVGKGTGLGLHVCLIECEKINAKLSYNNDSNGSVFSIKFRKV